jgi:hypothetical protein
MMRRPLTVIGFVAAIFAAAVAGYAVAGGFSSEAAPGQQVSDEVMKAWATGDAASIEAIYHPAVKMVLLYDGEDHVVASSRKETTAAATGAIDFGNAYSQIGPVASYVAEDGDTYVATLVEVTGPGHPDGVPLVGFYRLRDGKVIRHIFMDAEHY